MRTLLFLTLMMLLTAGLPGQDFMLRVDSTVMSLGSDNRFHLIINESCTEVEMPDWSSVTDKIRMLRLQEQTPWKNVNSRWQSDVAFALYDTGRYVIPPLMAICLKGDQRDTLYSNTLPIQVYFNHDQEIENDLRGIIREKITLLDILWIVGAIIAAIALFYFLYRWTTRKKKGESEESITEDTPPEPAHVIALQALQSLREQQLWKKGEYKEHQTRLSMIVRRYLQGQYGIPAPESTTSQIMRAVRQSSIADKWNEDISALLQLADMVKYAKAEPPAEVHEHWLDRAQLFVSESSLKSTKEEEE